MVLEQLKLDLDTAIELLHIKNKETTDTRFLWKLEAYQEIRERIEILEKRDGF